MARSLRQKVKTISYIVALVTLPMLAGLPLHAYEISTHAHLMLRAFNRSALSDLQFLEELGVENGMNPFGVTYLDVSGIQVQERFFRGYEGVIIQQIGAEPLSIEGWLMRGVIREDDVFEGPNPQDDPNPENQVLIRVLRHFYDPAQDRPLTAPGLGILDLHTAPDWAIGARDVFHAPDIPEIGRRNHFTVFDAREALYRALTGRNKDGVVVAETKEERDKYWATMFRAQGDVVHLIQDMAQPQHTRNDKHAGVTPEIFTGHASVYEAYIEGRATGDEAKQKEAQQLDPTIHTFAPLQFNIDGQPYPTPRFTKYSDFFSTGDRSQNDPVAIKTRLGLADYNNRGFFSVGANFGDSEYALPSNNRDDYTERVVEEVLGRKTVYLLDEVRDSLNPALTRSDVHKTTESIWFDFIGAGGFSTFTLTQRNYDDMAELLVPRAVAYSAGLIDYFFRGRLEAVDPEFTETGVRLKVRNAINGQEVPEWNNEALFGQGSQFVVVVKFRQGGEERLIVSEAVTLNEDSILPGEVSIETLTFELAPVPVDATDVEHRLVFRGRLGEEDDAVAVGLITTPFVSTVAVGGIHSCVTTEKETFCFGANWNGELGTSEATDVCFPFSGELPECSFSPVAVAGNHQFALVTAGANHTCALDKDQQAFCWGWNGRGQIGGPTTDFCVGPFQPTLSPRIHSCTREPIVVADGFRFEQISAGGSHTCGIGSDGIAYCWGYNTVGQIGTFLSSTCDFDLPCVREPSAIRSFETVVAGSSHTCALDTDGFAWCWGSDERGQLGDGGPPSPDGLCGSPPNTFFCSATPVPVAQGRRYRSIDADGDATCAVTLEGDAYCWGLGRFGLLGDGVNSGFQGTERREPTLVVGEHKWDQIDVGSCGITEDGLTFCWGRGREGQFGNGTFDTFSSGTPIQVETIVKFRQVSSNGLNVCATDGVNAHCWGQNLFGETGVPASVDCSGTDGILNCNPRPVPVPIPGSASTLATEAPESGTPATAYEADTNLMVIVNSSEILTNIGYSKVEASMTGEVNRDDGSYGTYKVPLTFFYPLDENRCNEAGLVDVVNSGLYETFEDMGTDADDPRFPGLFSFARLLLGDDFLFGQRRGGYIYAQAQWNKLVIERQSRSGTLGDPTINIDEGTDGYQIIKDTSRFLRDPNAFLIGSLPGKPCRVRDVFALGYSQTAQLLRSFYFQGLNQSLAGERVFDDGLVFEGSIHAAGGGSCRELTDIEPWFSYSMEDCEGATPPNHGRVLTVNSETDVQILGGWRARGGPKDEPHYRTYEIAGTSHFPTSFFDLKALGLRDAATTEQNYVNTAPVFRAMMQNLYDWVREGSDPPKSAEIDGRIRRLGAPPFSPKSWRHETEVFITKLGKDGNTLGGVRLSHVRTVGVNKEVVGGPLGLYRGSECLVNAASLEDPDYLLLCQDLGDEDIYAVKGGTFIPYSDVDPAVCGGFYQDREAYVAAVTEAAERAAEERWVLPEEIHRLVSEALLKADEFEGCVPH